MEDRLSLDDLSYIYHLGNAEHYLYHLMLQSAEPSHTLTLLHILKEIEQQPGRVSPYQHQTVRVLLQQVNQTPSRFKYLFPVFRREIQAAIKAYFRTSNNGIFRNPNKFHLPAGSGSGSDSE